MKKALRSTAEAPDAGAAVGGCRKGDLMGECKQCGAVVEAGNVLCPDCVGASRAAKSGRIACPSCGAESASTAKYCYNCNAVLRPTPGEAQPPAAGAIHTAPTGRFAPYDDAYSVSRAVISAGNAVKVVAGILVGIVLIASIIAADQFGGAAVVLGVVYAATIGAALYVLGVLLSAVGQILRATLDTAVNTSRISPDAGVAQPEQAS